MSNKLIGVKQPRAGSRLSYGQTFHLAYTQDRQSLDHPQYAFVRISSLQFGIRILEFFYRLLKVKTIIHLWRKHKFLSVKEGGHDIQRAVFFGDVSLHQKAEG